VYPTKFLRETESLSRSVYYIIGKKAERKQTNLIADSMSEQWHGQLEQIDAYRWRIPRTYHEGMRVPGLIYANEKMISRLAGDQSPEQVANVAHLPGILRYSMAMPDFHWGYGFPIGGVAAMDIRDGVISPGGVGYDINCGVRLMRTDLELKDIKSQIRELTDGLFMNIPCGVGSTGKLKLSSQEEREVMVKGSSWVISKGYGWKQDVDLTEAQGALPGANPDAITLRAYERGKSQLGTLGAGNHFLEIQAVEEIFDSRAANVFGLFPDQIVVMIHTGSRGFGYQTCDDYLDVILKAASRYGIQLPDRQLACAPLNSKEGKDYLGAMAASANYAWANRQVIMHWVRETFEQVLKRSAENIGMRLVYDVAHNIAKFEEHEVDGKKVKVCVHRKGATRAFPPGHPEVPELYRSVGQPVLIPGDMGRNSFILVGTQKAMEETFGSTCHGAGRLMSRGAAIRATQGRAIARELADKGIIVRSVGRKTLQEEVPEAYKDVSEVVEVVHNAGLSRKVAKLRPLGVVKG